MTNTYQRKDISTHNSLQEAVVGMLFEVHLEKYSFLVLGLFRDAFNCAYDTTLNDRMVIEMEWTRK